ncbi:MAG: substrate-binding domain-containing protein [Limimaricola sp.]|uniref:LacI family DNA-binding transcriptional regulator n=1 Tax=Limimaricola sp. TaxID=2211665 RepID=UPI001D6C58CA|nr:LacI family DNA-binding transcriptional regulator [Limimaricola sp.]MBI1418445.1 substrate-binding domain-containing protein [Limimaricola sp.]
MTHRFPVKEIAAQAGLSTATVDRVLNARAHVAPQTRARVAAAIAELEGQEAQLAAAGRRVFVDVVIEAPARFTREVRAAAEAVLPHLGVAVVRPRFVTHEVLGAAQTAALLDRIAGRGSQGVCLKARDEEPVHAAVARLAERGIPVVTLVTDLPDSRRLAYAGLDNAAAGRTAAWLMAGMLAADARTVVTTQSDVAFSGEGARASAFVAALAAARPGLRLVDLSGGAGLDGDTARRFAAGLAACGPVAGVYSIGGGNRAILAELDRAGQHPQVFIGHDLDRDNRALLAEGRLTAVLAHDLAADMRHAFLQILAFHRLLPREALPPPSDVRIVTPHNMPRHPNL